MPLPRQCFQLGIKGEYPHSHEAPLSTAETQRAPQSLKTRVTVPPTKTSLGMHLPLKMFPLQMGRVGIQEKRKPGTTEGSVTAKAEAGLHGGDDPPKVSQPANGRPRNRHKTPKSQALSKHLTRKPDTVKSSACCRKYGILLVPASAVCLPSNWPCHFTPLRPSTSSRTLDNNRCPLSSFLVCYTPGLLCKTQTAKKDIS